MATKRTIRGWFEYLDDAKREFTLDEFVALMAFGTREYTRQTLDEVRQTQQAIEHIEGMLGTFDETLAARDPLYAALAAKRGGPMLPASPELLERTR